MYRLTKIYIYLYIYSYIFSQIKIISITYVWNGHVYAFRLLATMGRCERVMIERILAKKINKGKKWKVNLAIFFLGHAMESKRCCHSNRSSHSLMRFLPIGWTSQWNHECWWCVMFPRRWNSLESCDGPCAFLSFRKSPGSKSRGMLGYTVLKSTTGSPHFSWGLVTQRT